MVLPTVFEDVAESGEVVLKQPPAATGAGEPGQDTGVGCCVDYPVARRQPGDVARRSEVPMKELHAQPFDPPPVESRPRTHEVVYARHFDALEAFE